MKSQKPTNRTEQEIIVFWKKYAKQLYEKMTTNISTTDFELELASWTPEDIQKLEKLLEKSYIEMSSKFYKQIDNLEKTLSSKTKRRSETKKNLFPNLGVIDLASIKNNEKIYSVFVKRRDEHIEYFKKYPKYAHEKLTAHLQESKKSVTFHGPETAEAALGIAKVLKKTEDMIRRHANFIATDQLFKFSSSISEAQAEYVGATKYIWKTSLDERVRPAHQAREGKVFYYNNPPKGGGPGQDYYCLSKETKVSFIGGIKRAFKRFYTGSVVKITTKSGVSVSVTPNHPILTLRGWISAKDINSSDKLLNSFRPDMTDISNAEINNSQISCNTIFDLLSVRFSSKRTTGFNHQFHGDGVENKEIEVIDIPILLPNEWNTIFGKDFCKNLFPFSDFSETFTPSNSDISNLFNGKYFPSNRIMSLPNLISSLLDSHLTPFELFSFGRISDFCTGLKKACTDNISTGFKHFCDLIFANSRFIQSNNILDWEIFSIPGRFTFYKSDAVSSITHNNDYSDNVYNFETDNHIYHSNNIITSNCRCRGAAILKV